jgi:1,2-diacylglycerol 3-beta-galactosyltransferase
MKKQGYPRYPCFHVLSDTHGGSHPLKGSQRTILFLIADTGAGHRSAANAIRNAMSIIAQKEQEEWYACQQNSAGVAGSQEAPEPLSPQPPTYRIEIVDVFKEYSQFPLREAVKLYGPTIRYNPKLFGRVFHMSNRTQRVRAVEHVAGPLVHNGLLRLISSVQPDVIVSIHPMLNHVTIHALQDLGLHIPFITVVTDLVSVHQAWIAPGADAYIVPTEYARNLYLQNGLDPARIHLLGMPIDPKFTLPLDSKEELQRKLGLEPGKPVVLMVGGGEGSGGLRTAVNTISQAHLPVQLLIITGRNKRLYVHLQRSRSSLHVPAKVFGFVQNMPEMMHAADVIVTKAGPGTICEALACNLPIILSGYVPGQEEGNVTYVLENNVGSLAYDSIELLNTLRRLLKPGSELRCEQVANGKRISRPQASFDIARTILSFLPAADAPGIWENAQILRPPYVRARQIRPGTSVRVLSPKGLSRRVSPRLRPGIAASRRSSLLRLRFLRRSVHNPSQYSRAASKRLARLIDVRRSQKNSSQ